MKLINKANNFVIDNIKIATSFSDRGIGLMFKKKMVDFNALVIDPCRSIHTMFMKFSIDVMFVSRSGEVRKIIYKMRPWRFSSFVFSASYVIEMESSDKILNFNVGDKVEIHD